ncbi:hypothetical protein DBV39_11755 [Orrella marina]|uniref:Uncharacterized protein n=1 Tax=Orrella marina TaxID=2163011 RepID=A0A2R4XKE6_9BURK|nr:hypothetical protein DBV39_11755 [Orrella marina]
MPDFSLARRALISWVLPAYPVSRYLVQAHCLRVLAQADLLARIASPIIRNWTGHHPRWRWTGSASDLASEALTNGRTSIVCINVAGGFFGR